MRHLSSLSSDDVGGPCGRKRRRMISSSSSDEEAEIENNVSILLK